MLSNILEKLRIDNIGEPPYSYDLLINLDEKEYPKYLKKMFKNLTGQNLNLKNPKTFNEKIQWIKLYDATPLKTQLTDKVLVRDWVKDKIGEEYLKPVLWVGTNFSEIPFDDLPDSFIIKANHGCKWNYTIKNKKEFVKNEVLMKIISSHFNGWLSQNFFPWAGFEMQYKYIEPKMLIEPLLREDINEKPEEIEVYCFNGEVKIAQKIKYKNPREVSIYDETYNHINLKFMSDYNLIQEPADDNIKLAVKLSDKLSKGFKLARVDWLIYKNKLYFNEITFTPFSGFYKFEDEKWNMKLGSMLDLRKD